jgi:hypothetical protein
MIDNTYKETRTIRPCKNNPLNINITCKCDNMSEVVQVAEQMFKLKRRIYVICDRTIYSVDGRDKDGYLISGVVNM